jgi:uncharacterized protein (TIGR00730 family)
MYTVNNICVFCSSSDAVDDEYFQLAIDLGKELVENNYTLVYGGARVGLMGRLAHTVKSLNGKIIGIIPEFLANKELAYHEVDSLIITKDLRARKAKMDELSDVFIALPGGFGTLEEILEVMTLKQLNLLSKPIIFINHNGFYEHLIAQFEHLFKSKFTKPEYREIYFIAKDVKQAMDYLKDYREPEIGDKWFKSLVDPTKNLNIID